MDNTISLLKPIPDDDYFSMDEDQIRFFATLGFNFCLGITCSSYITLVHQYSKLKEVKPNDR